MRTGAPADSLIQQWNQSAAAKHWILLPLNQCLACLRSGSTELQSHCENLTDQEPNHYLVAVDHKSLSRLPKTCQTTVLASSRFPKVANSQDGHSSTSTFQSALAAAVRTSLLQTNGDIMQRCLVSGQGMTLDAVVCVAARSLDIPLIRFQSSNKKSLASWLKHLAELDRSSQCSSVCELRISPALRQSCEPLLMDALVFSAAQQVHAFFLQLKSKTLCQLKDHLESAKETDAITMPPRVWIPNTNLSECDKALIQHQQVATKLMNAGCVGWYLPADRPTTAVEVDQQDRNVKPFPENLTGYLFHHTRACKDTWPEETEEEHWLRWLLGNPRSESTGPLQTLHRILAQGILRASGKLIPTGRPMICFSQRSPRESYAARTFRTHLSRWDYEPYGLAISQNALIDRGAKAVEYWERQPPNDVAVEFTQKQFTESDNGQHVDWSLEQEYRLPENLDLKTLGQNDIMIFVPTKEEAQELSQISRWSVGYLSPVAESHS